MTVVALWKLVTKVSVVTNNEANEFLMLTVSSNKLVSFDLISSYSLIVLCSIITYK